MNFFKNGGLYDFISDIRRCKSKEDETKRVHKELANIRSKFSSSKILVSYKKKKYVCKLVFIFLLGHNVEIGHIEAVNILNSNKYSEKFVGYLFASVVMNAKSELTILITSAVQHDLASHCSAHTSLALTFAANSTNQEMAETLHDDVAKLCLSGEGADFIRQSAMLCLLQFYRVSPSLVPPEGFADRLIGYISEDNLGLVTSALSLIQLFQDRGQVNEKSCFRLALSKLQRIVQSVPLDLKDYNYYEVQAPWLTIKLLKLITSLKSVVKSQAHNFVLNQRLESCVRHVFNKLKEPNQTKKLEPVYLKYAVAFEVISMVQGLELDSSFHVQLCDFLENSLKKRDPNLRCLSLDSMERLAKTPSCQQRIKQQLNYILQVLNAEKDESIRRKALKVLYVLSDTNNARGIIKHLFIFLENVQKSENVAKSIADITEKCYDDPLWYVDVMFLLLNYYGDYVEDKIWHKAMSIIIKEKPTHGYAAVRAFEHIQVPYCDEKVKALSAYVLGEFGNLIAGDPRSSPEKQLLLLQSNFIPCSKEVKLIFLNSFIKFANLFSEVKNRVMEIFEDYASDTDVEIQKRAAEYLKMCQVVSNDKLSVILDQMPYSLSHYTKNKLNLNQNEKPVLLKQVMVPNMYPAKSISMVCSNVDKGPAQLPPTKASQSYPELLNDINRSANPDFNRSTNPDFNLSANPDFNRSANPDHNRPANPDFNRSANLDFNRSANLDVLSWHKSGTLLENSILEVSFHCNFRGHQGFLNLNYRNKSLEPINHFDAQLQFDKNTLKMESKVCSSSISPLTDIEQKLLVECLQEFQAFPTIYVTYLWSGTSYSNTIILPLAINRFVKSVLLSQDDFLKRWNKMGHRYFKTFKSKQELNKDIIHTKLERLNIATYKGSSYGVLTGSGVFCTRAAQIGFLLQMKMAAGGMTNVDICGRNEQFLKKMAELLEKVL